MNDKQIFSIAAFVVFVGAALAYSPLVDSPYLGDTLALIGTIPMILVLWAGRDGTTLEAKHRIDRDRNSSSGQAKISPLLVIGIIFLLALSFITPMNIHLQFILFVGGIVFIGSGLSGFHVGARHRLAQLDITIGQGNALPLLILTTLLAFGLRIINLENSLHIWVDEAHFVDGITRLQDNPNTPLLTPMNFIASFSWLYAYLEAHSVAIFGTTLAAPRIISAVFGTMTIPATYFLATQLVTRQTSKTRLSLPLLSALLIAVFPPHVHFSRLALNNIADPLFGVLMMAFLLKAIREQRTSALVLSGIFLALTQYSYEGGKIIFPMIGLISLGFFVISKRVYWKHTLLVVIAFLLIVMPLWITLLRGGYPYFPRAEAQRLSGPDAPSLLANDSMTEITRYFKGNLAPAWHHLISQEERNGNAAHYGGATGLILPVLIPFFLMGLVIMLWQGNWIPILVIVLTIFGNSLIMNPDMSARFVVAFPFIVISISAGLNWVISAFISIVGSRIQIHPYVFLIIPIYSSLIFTIAAISIVCYFGPHLNLFNEQIRPARDHQDVGWRSLSLPPGTQVYLFTDELTFYPHIEILEHYTSHDLNLHINHPLHLMLRGNSRLPDDSHLAIFIQPQNRELLQFLSHSFTLPEPQYSPYNIPEDKQYALYFIPHK